MSEEHVVTRITSKSLKKIFDGKVRQETPCIIKVYSQRCEYCKNLVSVFHQVAQEDQSNRHFFAFNIGDVDYDLDEFVKLKGVPSIIMVTPNIKQGDSNVRILQEPSSPHRETWYTIQDIKKFIDTHKE
jgi:thioredoxin-like negative regulator of GroEL